MPGIATSRKSSLLNFSLGIMSPISEQPVSTKSPEQIRKIKLSKSIYFNIPTISNLYVSVTYIIYIYSPPPLPTSAYALVKGCQGHVDWKKEEAHSDGCRANKLFLAFPLKFPLLLIISTPFPGSLPLLFHSIDKCSKSTTAMFRRKKITI